MIINGKDYILTFTQIQKLQELHVKLTYIFGSYAESTTHVFSDIDIGVVFLNNVVIESDLGKIYNELYNIFTDIFPDKTIDIVFLQKAGLELCFDVICHGVILYEASPDARFEFEENINILYADFKPLLYEFNRVILDRIQV